MYALFWTDAGTAINKYGRIIPHYSPVFIGNTINLTCYSSITPTWRFENDNVPQPHRISGISLLILDATEDHTGKYGCFGTFTNGTPFYNNSWVFVGGMYYT